MSDVQRIARDKYQMYFDRDIPPVASASTGDTIVFETEDAHCSAIRDTNFSTDSMDELFEKFGGLNPVTGPLYVDGAKPGDCLSVAIRSMGVSPVWGKAYSSRASEGGALESPYSLKPLLPPKTTVFDIEDGHLLFPTKKGTIRLPVQPMIGTIGVAPKYERRMSFAQGVDFMGNVDVPDIGPGATVVLPVHHEGGLLSLGDCHAKQGDGEISAGGIEIQADVEVKIDVLSGDETGFVALPQVNTDEWIGSVASYGGVTLADNVRAAYVDLVRRLETYYGFDMLEAHELLGHAGTVRVGLMCDPEFSAMARIERVFIE